MSEIRLVLDKINASWLLKLPDPELEGRANAFLRSHLTRGLSRYTARAYGFDLVILFRWLAETQLPIAELTQVDVLHFVEVQKAKGAKPRSINRRLVTIEQFFKFCFDKTIPSGGGVTAPSPHYRGRGYDAHLGIHWKKRSGIKLRVKVPRTLVEPLATTEVSGFLKGIKRYRDIAIVLFMVLCGLRSCEIIALRKRDVDLRRKCFRVRGKGDVERAIPLPDLVIEAVEKYLDRERPEKSPAPNLFVILQGSGLGQRLTPAGVRSFFRHHRILSQIDRANAHRFRHTFGTDMARAGVSLPVLQKLMGHGDMATTLQYINLSMADVAADYHKAMDFIRSRYAQDKAGTDESGVPERET
jgi:site-specific recombinase XerD